MSLDWQCALICLQSFLHKFLLHCIWDWHHITFLVVATVNILLLKSRIPKKRRKGSLGVHRSFYMSKRLPIKHFVPRKRISQTGPVFCAFKKPASSSPSCGDAEKKENSHQEQAQPRPAQLSHTNLWFSCPLHALKWRNRFWALSGSATWYIFLTSAKKHQALWPLSL